MTLMSWLHDKLVGRPRDVVREAIEATEDAINKTRSLRQQLEPYARERDPFAAILTAHDSASSYQKEQDRGIVETWD